MQISILVPGEIDKKWKWCTPGENTADNQKLKDAKELKKREKQEKINKIAHIEKVIAAAAEDEGATPQPHFC